MIKQKIIFIIFLTLTLTSFYAQNSVNQYDNKGERHGLWTKNYEGTNQKRYEGVFYHGKEVDTFKYYKLKHKKSVLSAIRVFRKHDSIADVTFFTSNQKVIGKGKMDGKMYIGEWLYYHKNSDKLMIKEYYNNNGKLDGKKRVYYENGIVAEFLNYENGELEGEAKWFTKRNKLIKHLQYKEGKLNGKAIIYDGLGNITSEGDYKENKKIGIWMFYDKGELIKKIDYTNQKIVFKKKT